MTARRGRLSACLALVVLWSIAAAAQSPQALLNRAIDEFENGRFGDSAGTFDRLVQAAPAQAPYLWQRGIALYYAKRYTDCQRQFESHRTVNAADVENAAWHFLCVARAESAERAKAALLPVGPDSRTPMADIYEMFHGRRTPEQVLAAAGPHADGQFYAHLYVGLYLEALGLNERALEHITMASADRFEAAGGYMHMVARVHRRALTSARP